MKHLSNEIPWEHSKHTSHIIWYISSRVFCKCVLRSHMIYPYVNLYRMYSAFRMGTHWLERLVKMIERKQVSICIVVSCKDHVMITTHNLMSYPVQLLWHCRYIFSENVFFRTSNGTGFFCMFAKLSTRKFSFSLWWKEGLWISNRQDNIR